MFISEDIFNDQMRALMVARGRYESEKKKDEIKRYWYLEFRDCDEQAFIRVMQELKFAGDGGFPSFADFRDRYKIIMPHSLRDEGREYCGLCHKGIVIFRGYVEESGEVRDMAAGCSRCSPKRAIQINPHKLHKDRLGYLRTAEALIQDRKKIEIKLPEWIFQRHPKLKEEKVYFQGLNPINDPDIELEFIKPAPVVPQVPY
jgi:hypothetical protein